MKYLVICVLIGLAANKVLGESSVLDEKFTPLLRFFRIFLGDLTRPKTFERGLKISIKDKKVQRQLPDSEPFFCDVNGPGARSQKVPTSVHELRPGDIDIVGAIGDSLTASNGAFAIDPLHVLLEGKGVSWAIGGQDNWRHFLTLPNILKEFNPNLYGYSVSPDGLSFQKAAKFNAAEPGAMSRDTVHQAKNIVKRMRGDSNVNMKQHWKIVNYHIGGNDFCLDICYYNSQEIVLQNMRRDLTMVLRILRDNLPRTMVNIVLPPNVAIIKKFTNKPGECQALHYVECPCMMSLNHLKDIDKSMNTIKRWNTVVKEVVDLEEFHNRSDFAVNLHSFTKNTDVPKTADGNTDYTYLSEDCFHLSQKGHALAATALWNSILTAEASRATVWTRELEDLKCPTNENPFLATRKNS